MCIRDSDKDAKTTRLVFQTVQNKMHYAVHRHTAAELIVERADANREHMGDVYKRQFLSSFMEAANACVLMIMTLMPELLEKESN